MTPHPSARARPGTFFRFRPVVAGIAAAVLTAGCDIPTDPPEVETRWIVPAEETRFGVAELLPGDVTLNADSSAFLVDFDPIFFSQALAGLCPLCVAADGTTVPKPPFQGGFSSTVSFPPEVEEVEIIDGQIRIDLVNGFNFDPIRPAAGVFGSLELVMTDAADGDSVGSLTIDGQDQGFPAGSTLTEFVAFGSATVEGGIEATILIDSPTGDPVTIDAGDLISVDAAPVNVRVGGVVIDVANESVTFDPVRLDLEDVEADLIDRVVSGDFVLDVVNPFGVAADFDLQISGPTIATLQKSATIDGSPESSVIISFSGAEIRSFLGEPDVVLSAASVVDASAGIIPVDPGQELVLTAALDVVLRLGGEG